MAHVDISVCPGGLSVYPREKFLESSRYIRYAAVSDGFQERRVAVPLPNCDNSNHVLIVAINMDLEAERTSKTSFSLIVQKSQSLQSVVILELRYNSYVNQNLKLSGVSNSFVS
jgi:hypothetical protein